MSTEPAISRSRAGSAAAIALVAGVLAATLAGFFAHTSTLGAHDWDYMETHRAFAVLSIRRFGQFPFWDPFGCGGFPAWGAAEGATNVVSPLLPIYLLLPLAAAVRIEIALLLVALVSGLWFFARRYVERPLSLAFVCVVGGLSSRMALQVALGHAWHLVYAGLPWVLGAFDRATEDRAPPRTSFAWAGLGALVFAWMIYDGGIYPVPHAALCLLGVATYRAWARREASPLVTAGAMIAWGAALSAPKLFAVLEVMGRFPRFVRSPETVPPSRWLSMFLASTSSIPGLRVPGLDYLWHEYGQYVGPLPLALIAWGTLRRLPGDARLRSLRFVGASLLVLALGAWGPWRLLHLVPPFGSQHVPSRFTYPAFMLLSVIAARSVEERLASWDGRGRLRVAVALWAAFAASAALVAREDARCTLPWFSLEVPEVTARAGPFVDYAELPREYAYGDGDAESPGGTNGAPGLLAHRAGIGAIRCSAFPGLNQDAPLGGDGRPLHLGARGVGDPLYRGEYRVEPAGRVTVARWSPSEVSLDVRGARPGELVVLNQNWDPGWSANGAAAVNHGDVCAYVLARGDETVTFRYRPRSLPFGLAALAMAALALPLGAFRLRRRV